MQALRWHGRADLRLDDVEEPDSPGPGEALIDVRTCGICGTDLHEYQHGPNMIRQKPHPLTGAEPPLTLGHEFSGTLLQLGDAVPGFSAGDRVTVDPCIRCGRCRWCVRGEYHICVSGGSIGLASDGAFARTVRVPVECLVRIPDGVPDEQAALAEPLAVGMHAVSRAQVAMGDTVVVLGAGPIGVAVLLSARLAGASSIVVSEPNADRAARAAALGATEVYDPTTTDVRREVFLRTGRIGPDVVIEATGRPELVQLAVTTVRRGGRVALAGISDADLQVNLRQVVLYERSIHGSLGYNFDIPRVLDLMATGRLDASSLITGVRPLSEGPDVFAELAADRGRHLKVLLTPKDA